MATTNDYTNATHHDLDVKPIPEQVLYINEPHITGDFCGSSISDLHNAEQLFKKNHDGDTASWYPAQSLDHIRVYVPLDLSKECILAYFRSILDCFGCADEKNEMALSCAIGQVIARLEIYDQVWLTREMSKPWKDDRACLDNHNEKASRHSWHASEIARVLVDELVQLAAVGCTAECFPYETVDMLCKEYNFEMVDW